MFKTGFPAVAGNDSGIVRQLGHQPYELIWEQMKNFTLHRTHETPDEIWLVEHPPVYTFGQNIKPEHLLTQRTGHYDIPIVYSDRGGQITYHGPGQLIVYVLLDIRRLKMDIRRLITCLENTVIATLSHYDIASHARQDAPGIYSPSGAKICSIGLRVRRGYTYHGIALNVNMDLTPFLNINPCGIKNLTMTQTADLGGPQTTSKVEPILIRHLCEKLGYNATPSIIINR